MMLEYIRKEEVGHINSGIGAFRRNEVDASG